MFSKLVKPALLLNYFVFAALLSSVGTVMLMVQSNFSLSPGQASVIEGFKDIPIAIVSFLIASLLIRIGYKRAMLIGLMVVTLTCCVMPFLPYFWMTKLLFLMFGASFGLVKVATMSTIGLVAKDNKEHISFMNYLDSFYMIGLVAAYFIFSYFIGDRAPADTGWLNVYFLLAGISMFVFIINALAKIDESSVRNKKSDFKSDFKTMLRLMSFPVVIIFCVSIFLSILIEQSIMSWLPTFNRDVLQIPTMISVQLASIIAATQALGRLGGGIIFKKYNWYKVVSTALVMAALLIIICMPMAKGISPGEIHHWWQAPIAAFIFPLIGFCLAPVYPAINSVMLVQLPKHLHGPMSGLIVVFSALGGTIGSIITGNLFSLTGGRIAFYFILIPIAGILIALYFFYKKSQVKMADHTDEVMLPMT